MKSLLRGAVALSLVVVALPLFAQDKPAQDKQVLASEREKISYVVGMDIAPTLAPAADDVDMAAFERALRNGMDGGKPLIEGKDATETHQALIQRVAAGKGQQIPGMPPGSLPPAVDKEKAGLLMGADISRSLQPAKDEVDLPIVMQGIRTVLAKGTPLVGEAEASTLRKSFGERMRVKLQDDAAHAGDRNAADGAAFMAKNKTAKGVFTTPSGLQYMVLKQGSGRRPLPTDQVRVNYTGTLLDGTVFDSTDQHGGPAEFGLGQVIAGWTEGLPLMPIGAKYRFWVPGNLAYGAKGSQGIGPNSTLVFEVELLDIL